MVVKIVVRDWGPNGKGFVLVEDGIDLLPYGFRTRPEAVATAVKMGLTLADDPCSLPGEPT